MQHLTNSLEKLSPLCSRHLAETTIHTVKTAFQWQSGRDSLCLLHTGCGLLVGIIQARPHASEEIRSAFSPTDGYRHRSETHGGQSMSGDISEDNSHSQIIGSSPSSSSQQCMLCLLFLQGIGKI